MKLRIAMFLLLIAADADAQLVHKCVGKEGAISYQSEPCPKGLAAKTWTARPEPTPSNDELWRRYYAKKKGEADSRYLSGLARRSNAAVGMGASIGPNASDTGRCDAMRRMRAANVNNDTGFDARRSWNDAVADACK